MNRNLCLIGIMIIIIGAIFYFIAIGGDNSSSNRAIETQKDYYQEIWSDTPSEDRVKEIQDDEIEAAEDMQTWVNVGHLGSAIVYIGIAICFLSLYLEDPNKAQLQRIQAMEKVTQYRPAQPPQMQPLPPPPMQPPQY